MCLIDNDFSERVDMPDMLIRLYALPDHTTILKEGYLVRRAAAYDKSAILQWIC